MVEMMVETTGVMMVAVRAEMLADLKAHKREKRTVAKLEM